MEKNLDNQKKEPIILKELELNDKEIYLGELKDGDKFQILCRHLDILRQINQSGVNSMNMFLSYMFEILKAMAKKQGIDVKKLLEK